MKRLSIIMLKFFVIMKRAAVSMMYYRFIKPKHHSVVLAGKVKLVTNLRFPQTTDTNE
jgi:hypothetical protein